jgi:hypothetical protein
MHDDDVSSLTLPQLIEASSLSTPASRRFRRQTPPIVTEQLMIKLFARPLGASPRATDRRTPYFFLSHAPFARPEERADVRELFDLLCGRLLPMARDLGDEDATGPRPAPGLLADDVRAAWGPAPALPAALFTCRVFVPLLSPGYLSSDRCLSELAAFQRHDDELRSSRPFAFSAVVPVLWTGAGDLDAPEHLDLDLDDAWGDEYHELGLHGLARSNRPAFHRVLFRILEHIRDVAEVAPVSAD